MLSKELQLSLSTTRLCRLVSYPIPNEEEAQGDNDDEAPADVAGVTGEEEDNCLFLLLPPLYPRKLTLRFSRPSILDIPFMSSLSKLQNSFGLVTTNVNDFKLLLSPFNPFETFLASSSLNESQSIFNERFVIFLSF